MLHVEKREGLALCLVREVTCVTFRWKGDYRAWALSQLANPRITVSDMNLDRTKLNQKTIAKKSIVENKETADSKFV